MLGLYLQMEVPDKERKGMTRKQGYPLQNSMDCIIHGVAKRMSDFFFTSEGPKFICRVVPGYNMINREGARMHELKRAEKRGHSILGKPKPAHNNLLLICFFLVYSSVCYLKQRMSILILCRQT